MKLSIDASSFGVDMHVFSPTPALHIFVSSSIADLSLMRSGAAESESHYKNTLSHRSSVARLLVAKLCVSPATTAASLVAFLIEVLISHHLYPKLFHQSPSSHK